MTAAKYQRALDVVSALNLLLSRSARARPGERKSQFEHDRRLARSLLTGPNVLGFGVGPKLSGTGRKPHEICLVIFVRRKLPNSRLRHQLKIPKHLFLETLGLKIRTDVQVWGNPPEAHSVSAGDSVGDLAGNSGTMTLAVTDVSPGAGRDPLILGCSHVLANAGQGHVDDPVDSPASPFTDPGPNLVGHLRRFTIINQKSASNEIDAAVAVPLRGIDLSNDIPRIGVPAGIRDLRPEGHTVINQLTVQRPGQSTGVLSGLIRNIHVSAGITYHQLPGDPSVRFMELVQYEVLSEEGDSGAAVLDTADPLRVVGMHIAGIAGDSISFFTHIGSVFRRMKIQFP
jgi:hypothetical protein